jgi:hypothetical protein
VPMGLESVSADWTKGFIIHRGRSSVTAGLNAIWKENKEKNVAIGILAAEKRIAPDQVKWSMDKNSRAIWVSHPSAGTMLAADVIKNKPAGLEMDPKKFLTASEYAAYDDRLRGRK